MAKPKYHRVLIKISGESLCAPGSLGVDPAAVKAIVDELIPIVKMGTQMGVVVGAGNLIRGRHLAETKTIHNTTADYMGMLGTVINALALRDALQADGVDAVVMSAIRMPLVCEAYFRPRAMEYLAAGRVIIFAAGTSHPGVTTDMCAAIRAAELDAEVLLKATKVDGVFDSDPEKNPDAKKYDALSYEKAITDRLGVMDLSAMAFCMERNMPTMVFKLSVAGNLAAAVEGRTVGTIVTAGPGPGG